jgi:hypothetical protein
MFKKKIREYADPQGTKRSGLFGLYELILRRFKTVGLLLLLIPLMCFSGVILGVALVPGIYLFNFISAKLISSSEFVRMLGQGISLGVGFFLFGFALIFLVPLANLILGGYPKPSRGSYFSVNFFKWFVHNSLIYILRYTVLEFFTPTPFNLLFYRLMGMKIGHNTQINSTRISDPALIELGDNVTIGGSATLLAHYGQGGYLVLAPLKIGDGVTIGLMASIMGGVEIGEGAKILPHSVVLPKTIIPPGETWAGVPATKVQIK